MLRIRNLRNLRSFSLHPWDDSEGGQQIPRFAQDD
jgi:hypothetical protein